VGLLWLVAAVVGGAASSVDAGETINLFDGKSLAGWSAKEPVARSRWTVAATQLDSKDAARLALSTPAASDGALVNDAQPKPTKETRGVDIFSQRKFGDCTIELEFMVPQGSNSGVYVMGEYEIQIKDSYGQEKLTYQGLGAIYKVATARVNAARQPGQWQSMRIEFIAPRFEGGKKVANARIVKIVLNDQVIHENLELTDVTPGGLTGKEMAAGPLMFQGDHGPVAYRSIRVTLP
jgi:stress-induced morphogen